LVRATELVPVGAAHVSRLGFGCTGIGGLYHDAGDAAAAAALVGGGASGIRYFDVAPVYGMGRAEERLGRFLQETEGAVADCTVSTKVGRLIRPTGSGGGPVDAEAAAFFAPNEGLEPILDYSYDGALRSLEESLTRLRVSSVDIVFVHDPDAHRERALAGAHRALERLRDERVVKAVGIGGTDCRTLAWFVHRCRLDCVLVAGRYTLLDQSALAELLPLCLERQVTVIAGGVFNSGILATPRDTPTFDYVPAAPETVDRAAALADLADRRGVALAAAALRFPLGHPAVGAVLMGPRSANETRRDVELFEGVLPTPLWRELGEILDAGVPLPMPG
jgi:D-threo-aldose 1-dehydrogenase